MCDTVPERFWGEKNISGAYTPKYESTHANKRILAVSLGPRSELDMVWLRPGNDAHSPMYPVSAESPLIGVDFKAPIEIHHSMFQDSANVRPGRFELCFWDKIPDHQPLSQPLSTRRYHCLLTSTFTSSATALTFTRPPSVTGVSDALGTRIPAFSRNMVRFDFKLTYPTAGALSYFRTKIYGVSLVQANNEAAHLIAQIDKTADAQFSYHVENEPYDYFYVTCETDASATGGVISAACAMWSGR